MISTYLRNLDIDINNLKFDSQFMARHFTHLRGKSSKLIYVGNIKAIKVKQEIIRRCWIYDKHASAGGGSRFRLDDEIRKVLWFSDFGN